MLETPVLETLIKLITKVKNDWWKLLYLATVLLAPLIISFWYLPNPFAVIFSPETADDRWRNDGAWTGILMFFGCVNYCMLYLLNVALIKCFMNFIDFKKANALEEKLGSYDNYEKKPSSPLTRRDMLICIIVCSFIIYGNTLLPNIINWVNEEAFRSEQEDIELYARIKADEEEEKAQKVNTIKDAAKLPVKKFGKTCLIPVIDGWFSLDYISLTINDFGTDEYGIVINNKYHFASEEVLKQKLKECEE